MAFAPAAEAEVEAVLAPLVEPPELFCLRAAVRVLSSVAHGLAEPGITGLPPPAAGNEKMCVVSYTTFVSSPPHTFGKNAGQEFLP